MKNCQTMATACYLPHCTNAFSTVFSAKTTTSHTFYRMGFATKYTRWFLGVSSRIYQYENNIRDFIYRSRRRQYPRFTGFSRVRRDLKRQNRRTQYSERRGGFDGNIGSKANK